MIDIGANLANSSFSTDLEDVVTRAKQAGLEKIIVTGSCFASNRDALALTRSYPDFLYSTAGLHPHYASQWDDTVRKQIESLIEENTVVALGETGLDYNRNFSPPEAQRHAFENLLDIAEQYSKPLFLHQRDAHADFYAILSNHPALFERAVVHCFTDTEDALLDYIEKGCFIGITGWICDKKRGSTLREIVKHIPLDRLMIESDAPYLMPHRDQLKSSMAHKNRNEPHTLNYVAKQIGESTGQSEQHIIEMTTANAKRFFKL